MYPVAHESFPPPVGTVSTTRHGHRIGLMRLSGSTRFSTVRLLCRLRLLMGHWHRFDWSSLSGVYVLWLSCTISGRQKASNVIHGGGETVGKLSERPVCGR